MTAGLLIGNDGNILARIQDGELLPGETDPVVAGWFKNGVPSLAGVMQGDLIVEHVINVAPSDPLFLLAVMEEAERRDWTIVEESDDEVSKSEVGDKPGHPFHGNQYVRKHVYHGTSRAKLNSIKQFGLQPNEHGNPLNFHHIESSADYYAGDDGVLMRVASDDLPQDSVHDELTSRSWTGSTVPPDKIEIKEGGEWKPLIEKIPPRPPNMNYFSGGKWTDKRPHRTLYPMPGGGLTDKPPAGFEPKKPKAAAAGSVPSYWGNKPKKDKYDLEFDDYGSWSTDPHTPGSGGSSYVYKPPPLKELPELGDKFVVDKPDLAVTGINGMEFTTPPAKFWEADQTPRFEGEPMGFANKIGQDEKYVIDPVTKEEYKERFTFVKSPSSGAILMEPDGRMWLVEPKGHYGGYDATVPKGGVEKELNPRQNAVKEIFEETGLQAKLTGYIADMEGDTTVTRYYLGERVGGDPKLAGPEAASVRLVTPDDALKMLNRDRDKKLVGLLKAKLQAKSSVTGEASANISTSEIALPGGYFDGKVPGLDYNTSDYDATAPLAAIELIPFAIYFNRISRLDPIRRPLLVGDDPTQVAMDATAASFDDDNAAVILTSWRPDKTAGQIFSYAVLLSIPAGDVHRPNYPLVPISNVALMDLDNNSIALFAIQTITDKAHRDLELRLALPVGWWEAMREFLPQAGRELQVLSTDQGREGGFVNSLWKREAVDGWNT